MNNSMKPEAAPVRVEQLKQWIDAHKAYLVQVLVTERVEINISMKGSSIRVKTSQLPDE